jgi:ferritin-like metal-binding protein YciE
MLRRGVIMYKDKLTSALQEIANQEHLISRFENDMLEMHKQMQFLEIVFDNLKNTMIAIYNAQKTVRDIIKE